MTAVPLDTPCPACGHPLWRTKGTVACDNVTCPDPGRWAREHPDQEGT